MTKTPAKQLCVEVIRNTETTRSNTNKCQQNAFSFLRRATHSRHQPRLLRDSLRAASAYFSDSDRHVREDNDRTCCSLQRAMVLFFIERETLPGLPSEDHPQTRTPPLQIRRSPLENTGPGKNIACQNSAGRRIHTISSSPRHAPLSARLCRLGSPY